MRDLEIQTCQNVCTWAASGEALDGLPVFRCGGCGSEWVRTQPWTPIGADGTVSPEVAAEAARRRSAGGGATSAGGAAGAGSAGTGTTTGS